MQDRGLAGYIAELVGTLILVFVVGTVVTLYVATSPQAQTGSDFAVVGLAHVFILTALIAVFGGVSGGHFNPAVTAAAAFMKKIDPVDAAVYVLAQLSGGVLGALLVKGILLDEGRAGGYGAVTVSPLLGGNFQGMIVEAIGTFLLVLVIVAVAFNPKAKEEWAPLFIGTTLGLGVMVLGPLTGGSFNPARWFGPGLIGEEFGDVWPYVVGPLLGALAAAALFKYVISDEPRAAKPAAAPSAPPPPAAAPPPPPPPPPPAGGPPPAA